MYYELVQEYPNLLFVQKDRTLDAVSDVTKPNFLLIPEGLQKIQESKIFYNTAQDDQGVNLQWQSVTYLTPLDFLAKTQLNNDDKDPNTIVVEGFDNQKMLVRTNEFPNYCTSFDGVYLTFDSFNNKYDTTLQASKSRIVSTEMPLFLQQDDFVIPVPEHLSETYLTMVLAECYSALRQEENANLNRKARRMRIKMQQDSRVIGSGGRSKTKYGRTSPTNSFSQRRGVSQN